MRRRWCRARIMRRSRCRARILRRNWWRTWRFVRIIRCHLRVISIRWHGVALGKMLVGRRNAGGRITCKCLLLLVQGGMKILALLGVTLQRLRLTLRLKWISLTWTWSACVALSWGQRRRRRCRSPGSIIRWVEPKRSSTTLPVQSLLLLLLLLLMMLMVLMVLLARRRCRGRSVAGAGMGKSSIRTCRPTKRKRSRRRAACTGPAGVAAPVMLVEALHDLGLPLPFLGLLLLLLLPGHDIAARIALLAGAVAAVVVKAGPGRRPGPIQNLPGGPPGLAAAPGPAPFAGRCTPTTAAGMRVINARPTTSSAAASGTGGSPTGTALAV